MSARTRGRPQIWRNPGQTAWVSTGTQGNPVAGGRVSRGPARGPPEGEGGWPGEETVCGGASGETTRVTAGGTSAVPDGGCSHLSGKQKQRRRQARNRQLARGLTSAPLDIQGGGARPMAALSSPTTPPQPVLPVKPPLTIHALASVILHARTIFGGGDGTLRWRTLSFSKASL